MSCNRQCFDPASKWHNHEECGTCSGKDDGASRQVVEFRQKNWVPHAETQPSPISSPAPGGDGES